VLLNGACFCGAVRFAVEDAFLYAAYCHCSRCRRRSGSAFNAFGGLPQHQLQVSAGEEQLFRVGEGAKAYDCRCKQCFSLLYSVFSERQLVHVPLGVLLDAPSRRPDHHIYVGSKAPWYDIRDELPQFDELPPG
jgi:hypothetical protein